MQLSAAGQSRLTSATRRNRVLIAGLRAIADCTNRRLPRVSQRNMRGNGCAIASVVLPTDRRRSRCRHRGVVFSGAASSANGLIPVLDCVTYDAQAGTITAHFGYTNTNANTTAVAIGDSVTASNDPTLYCMTGSSGPSGPTGADGASCPSGPSGVSGRSGPAGPSGVSGFGQFDQPGLTLLSPQILAIYPSGQSWTVTVNNPSIRGAIELRVHATCLAVQ